MHVLLGWLSVVVMVLGGCAGCWWLLITSASWLCWLSIVVLVVSGCASCSDCTGCISSCTSYSGCQWMYWLSVTVLVAVVLLVAVVVRDVLL